LHITGSKNPTGLNRNYDKLSFHPFFSAKDRIGAIITLIVILILTIIIPFAIGDPENFNPANPLNTPIHIQPE